MATEATRQGELDGAAAAKRLQHSQDKAAADEAALEQQGFTQRDAQGWALKLDSVPGSRSRLEVLVQERSVLTRKAEGVRLRSSA